LNGAAKCQAYQLDVRDSCAVDSFSESVIRDFGSADVVVLNAGINKNALLMSMSDEDWNEVISTNLSGAFYVSRAFIPVFLEKKFGRFIFLSSLSYQGFVRRNMCVTPFLPGIFNNLCIALANKCEHFLALELMRSVIGSAEYPAGS
jgi:NAD(P)-dependent dehydrogenase (short-subunit alcohol dehydrogenase family)